MEWDGLDGWGGDQKVEDAKIIFIRHFSIVDRELQGTTAATDRPWRPGQRPSTNAKLPLRHSSGRS